MSSPEANAYLHLTDVLMRATTDEAASDWLSEFLEELDHRALVVVAFASLAYGERLRRNAGSPRLVEMGETES